jgi:spermidine synthase
VIYVITLVLAFCSIVYELLLSQALSAFLGDTVLRYSVTIGLYLFSMGMGSIFAEGRFVKHPVVTMLWIEILLTLAGSLSIVLLYFVDWLGPAPLVYTLFAHSLIVVIGVLTGFEIPLLIEVRNLEKSDSENAVIGIDYLGAFLGTVLFAFLFYPKLGLVNTAFIVALLNALVGVMLVTQDGKVSRAKKTEYRALLAGQAALSVTLIACLALSSPINEYLVRLYLRA